MLSHKEQIGRLDRRITFQRKVFGEDVSNQKRVDGWINIPDYATVFANVEERSGSEVFQAEQLTGLKSSVFTIRYRTDISIEYRILFNGQIYDIQAILEVGRKRFLKITAEAGGQYADNMSMNSFSDTQYSSSYD